MPAYNEKVLNDLLCRHVRWSCLSKIELNSLESKTEFMVRFNNTTDRTIDVIWVNYGGNKVLYKCLKPNEFFDCRTFANHGWIAIDSQTKTRMNICNMPFFVLTQNNLLKLFIECCKLDEYFRQFLQCIVLNITQPKLTLKRIVEWKIVECFLKSKYSFCDFVNLFYSHGIPKQLINDAFSSFGFEPFELVVFDKSLKKPTAFLQI